MNHIGPVQQISWHLIKQFGRRSGLPPYPQRDSIDGHIHKNITNKIGNYINTNLWIRCGALYSVVSKMMDHIKKETTFNDYEVNLPEIVEGTKKLDFGVGDIIT